MCCCVALSCCRRTLLTVAVDDYHGLSAKQPCGTVRDTFGVERAVCTDKFEEMTAACKDCGKRKR